jgi:hypothetical protein
VDQVTRPKVESVLPRELVGWALRGRIRIPSFQRSYRWDRRDVIELFESILRGYPIGNLLVWQRAAVAGEVVLGHLKIEAPATGDAYWVIDGQQRIISLVGALTATSDTVDPRFRIYFDLGRGSFVTAARRQTPADDWLPVSITLNTAAANAWIRARSQLTEEQIALADQVIAAIRDYQIPMYIVTGEDDSALRDIFDRMNTFGKPMKSDEVFNALHSVAGEREPSDLHTLATAVRSFGFGEFSERVLMQSLLAIRGSNVDRDFRKEFKNDEDLHRALLATERAIGHVVDFLREYAGIPHIRLLPYSLYIPVLARFVDVFGPPKDRSAELLRRWIWRGAVVGVAPLGNTVGIRQGASAIHDDPVSSAGRLLNLLPPLRGTWRPDLSQTRLNRAQAKVNILGMLSLRPRLLPQDGSNPGESVNIVELLETGDVLHPITPTSPISVGGLSNRMIYPAGRRKFMYVALVARRIDPEILASHCLDEESMSLLRAGRFSLFVEHRAPNVADVIEQHVQRHALFGFRDGPDFANVFNDEVTTSDA